MNDNRLSMALCLCTLGLCCAYGVIGAMPDLINPAITPYEHQLVTAVLLGYAFCVCLAFGLGYAYTVLTRRRMA